MTFYVAGFVPKRPYVVNVHYVDQQKAINPFVYSIFAHTLFKKIHLWTSDKKEH